MEGAMFQSHSSILKLTLWRYFTRQRRSLQAILNSKVSNAESIPLGQCKALRNHHDTCTILSDPYQCDRGIRGQARNVTEVIL